MPTRQLHLRLTESEHRFLIQLAAEADESVNHLVRRFIRAQMHEHRGAEGGEREKRTTVVQSPLRLPQS